MNTERLRYFVDYVDACAHVCRYRSVLINRHDAEELRMDLELLKLMTEGERAHGKGTLGSRPSTERLQEMRNARYRDAVRA